jgi:uncharacterized protein
MEVFALSRGWLLRLDPGEDLTECLLAWVRQEALDAAEVRGIGAVQDVELGYFDLATKRYVTALFPESMELVHLQGNVAWTRAVDGAAEDAPILHAHAVVAGPELVARGGHLVRAVVSVTAELFVEPLTVSAAAPRLIRAVDERTGLKLLSGTAASPS